MQVRGKDGVRQVVVRRYPDDPQAQIHLTQQFALLEWLHARGQPVAEPLLIDTERTPALLTAFVPGSSEAPRLERAIPQLAEALSVLHSVSLDSPPLAPEREDPVEGLRQFLPDDPALDDLRDGLDTLTLPTAEPVLLHGDFWPGNVIWQDERLAAIIDWEDAAIGDPLCDLAGARVELLYAHDQSAADRLLAEYEAIRGAQDRGSLAIWEAFVCAAGLAHAHLWNLEPAFEARMRARGAALLADRARLLSAR